MSPTSTIEAKARPNQAYGSQTASQFTPALSNGVQLKWLTSGKPVLEGQAVGELATSLSHDDQFCLCVVGKGWQGCDIVPITHRSRENWLLLLTSRREGLINELVSADSDANLLNIAGTRIWAAVEAFSKAAEPKPNRDIFIERQEGDSVLFGSVANGHYLYVLTFPIQLSKGPQRIIAVVVNR